jgi:type I restriction enzyme S subunit
MADKQLDKYLPKLRFPEFKNDGEWKVKNLCDIAEKRVERNQGNLPLPVLTNSATEGVLNQAYYFERDIVSKDNLGNYYIVDKDDFVYNPRISSNAPVGPISRNKVGRGIMSPLYTVFRFRKGNLDFFEQFFKTICWHQYIRKKANFGARFDRINITAEDFFNLPVPFPSDSEQTQIATALCSLDSLIQACQEKLEQLKAHKKGLMQKLFPAPGKTFPEMRFKEFVQNGEWKIKKLGEIAEVFQGYGFPEKMQGKTQGKYPFIKVSDISTAAIGFGVSYIEYAKNYVDESDLDALSATPFPVGSVVFAKIGEALRLNRRAILLRPSLIDNNVGGIKAKNRLAIDSFVYYTMSNINLANYSGGVVPAVKKSTIENIDVLIPPRLEEQQKIADSLLSIDKTIGFEVNRIALLETHRKGLKQQLFLSVKR